MQNIVHSKPSNDRQFDDSSEFQETIIETISLQQQKRSVGDGFQLEPEICDSDTPEDTMSNESDVAAIKQKPPVEKKVVSNTTSWSEETEEEIRRSRNNK